MYVPTYNAFDAPNNLIFVIRRGRGVPLFNLGLDLRTV